MTANVTQLHPPIIHYARCDRDVYGRAILDFLEEYGTVLIDPSDIQEFVKDWRADHQCSCLDDQILAVQTRLTTARLAFKASLSEANAERVEKLARELLTLQAMKK